jgi:hypothetical protein
MFLSYHQIEYDVNWKNVVDSYSTSKYFVMGFVIVVWLADGYAAWFGYVMLRWCFVGILG